MSLWDAFSANVQKFAPQAFTLNYEIANDPELSGQEYHACARHVAACRSLGMDVEEHFSGQPTAYKAVVKQPGSQPCGSVFWLNTMPCRKSATVVVIRPAAP